MTDNEFNVLITSQLTTRMPQNAQLATVTGLTVQRSYQPRQQGANELPTVYFTKIGNDRRYGFPLAEDVYVAPVDPDPVGTFAHVETQFYETTFQFMALLQADPTIVYQLTASDVLNIVAGIIASDACRAAFLTAGAGVLRITDVRNVWFVDEKGRYESDPSFDVVFTHERSQTFVDPVAVTYDATIERV